MKKIISVIALASLAFGAFADAEFALNYRTQMTGFSRILSGDYEGSKDDKINYKANKHKSYLFAQKSYGGASDTISATVAGDMCGATIRIDPFPASDSGNQLQINQYSGYVNIGKFTLNAGAWKDGQYVGDWQLKSDADACNLGGETFAAYKLGNMFSSSNSLGIDDIANIAGGDKATTAYVKWGSAVGPEKTFVELYASAIGIGGTTWDDEKTVYSGFGFKADVTTKALRTQFIAKLPSIDKRAFGLYFMPQGTGALKTVFGGTLGFEGANVTEANADLRMRYAGKGYSVTFFNNLSHITNNNTVSANYVNKVVGAWAEYGDNSIGCLGVKTARAVAGDSQKSQKYNTAMWNLIALRYKISNKIFFTAEAGDMVYFNNMLNDDAAWEGIDAFVCPGFQFFAGGKTSISMGVRYGVSGLGAQVMNGNDRVSKYSSDNGNYEIATSILVPVVMRIRF